MTAIPFNGDAEQVREAEPGEVKRAFSVWATDHPFAASRVWLDDGPVTRATWKSFKLDEGIVELALLRWLEMLRPQFDPSKCSCPRQRAAIQFVSHFLECEHLHLSDGRAVRFVLPSKKEMAQRDARSILKVIASHCDESGELHTFVGDVATQAAESVGTTHRTVPARILNHWNADRRESRRELFERAIEANLDRDLGVLDRLAVGLALLHERFRDRVKPPVGMDEFDALPSGAQQETETVQARLDALEALCAALRPEFQAAGWTAAIDRLAGEVDQLRYWIETHNSLVTSPIHEQDIIVDRIAGTLLESPDPWVRELGAAVRSPVSAIHGASRVVAVRLAREGLTGATDLRREAMQIVRSGGERAWSRTIQRELIESAVSSDLAGRVAALTTAVALLSSVDAATSALDPASGRPGMREWISSLVRGYAADRSLWAQASSARASREWQQALQRLSGSAVLEQWRDALQRSLGQSQALDTLVGGLRDEYWAWRRSSLKIAPPFQWVERLAHVALEVRRTSLDAKAGTPVPTPTQFMGIVFERAGIDASLVTEARGLFGEPALRDMERLAVGFVHAPPGESSFKDLARFALRTDPGQPMPSQTRIDRLVTCLAWVIARARLHQSAAEGARAYFVKSHLPNVIRPSILGQLKLDSGATVAESSLHEILKDRIQRAGERLIRGTGNGAEERGIAQGDARPFQGLLVAYRSLTGVPSAPGFAADGKVLAGQSARIAMLIVVLLVLAALSLVGPRFAS